MPIIPSSTVPIVFTTEDPAMWTYSLSHVPITTGQAQAGPRSTGSSRASPHGQRQLPDNSVEDKVTLASWSRGHGTHFVLDEKTTRPSAPDPTASYHATRTAAPVIVRAEPLETTVITVNDATCQFALDLLREDYAGHGLPLTSLVIESSTFLLLAGFVFYCIWQLRRRVNRQRRLCTTTKGILPAYAFTADPPHKHTRPTRAQLSVPEVDEAPYSPSPTQSTLHTEFRPLSPKPPPLSPMRGTPGSPLRRAFHSTYITSNSLSSRDPDELQKKPSFLSLRG
ncbi:hypothetical protein C8Q78DRAFT_994808 [Trametes maxima]|nr:hypothetical protein C8Q78DRAFT_994808 [Trametes maxima]